MISAVSGGRSAALLSLSGRSQPNQGRADPIAAAQSTPDPLPPGKAGGATPQSLFEALLGPNDPSATGDGAIGGMLSSLLSRLDDNADGVISPEELSALLDRMGQVPAPGASPVDGVLSGIIAALDGDGDGKLGMSEMKAALSRLQGAAEPALSALAATPAPKSIYESLFAMRAGADGSAKSARRADAVADAFLDRLTR